jgi:hypothetical protein
MPLLCSSVEAWEGTTRYRRNCGLKEGKRRESRAYNELTVFCVNSCTLSVKLENVLVGGHECNDSSPCDE